MKRKYVIAGIFGVVLSTALLLFANLPTPRRQVELSLTSQQYLPGRRIELRIDMPDYLLPAKDEPLRADLALDKPESGVTDQELIASARLDAPELVSAAGETYEPLFPAWRASFNWVIRAQHSGVYQGVLWVYLQRRGEEGENHEALLAHPVELSVIPLLGLSSGTVRWIGIITLVISLALGLWGRRAS